MDEVELKGCPFCACRFFKSKLILLATLTNGSGDKWFEYRCPKCKAQIAVMGKTEEEAIAAWNTRPAVPVATEAEQECKEDSVHTAQNPSTEHAELEIQLPGLDTFVRTIIKRISGTAIELAIMRHSLSDDEGDEPDREAIDHIKSDIVDCMTGDEIGCNDPSESDETNCELIWLKTQLTNTVAPTGTADQYSVKG